MKVNVLGASGSEVAGHFCPAFSVDGKILLDAGTIGLSLRIDEEQEIRYILLSHAHFDHIKGIPFLLDHLVGRATGRTVTVMGAHEALDDLRTNILNGRIWPDFTRIPTPESPVVRYEPLRPGGPVRIDDYELTAVEVSHTVPAYGYILGNSEGRALAYTGDTGPTDRFWQEVDRIDVQCLIAEASFPNRMEDAALQAGHLTPSLLRRELAKLARRPPRIYITHAKPQYRREIEREIRELGRGDVRCLETGELLVI